VNYCRFPNDFTDEKFRNEIEDSNRKNRTPEEMELEAAVLRKLCTECSRNLMK
jgi:hypothetical protein